MQVYTGPNKKLWEYPVEKLVMFAVDVGGTFHCCRSVVPQMRERNYGRIVNLASVAGKEGNPNASAYSASKAAVIALTKSLGKELADTAIRVLRPPLRCAPLVRAMAQALDYMLGFRGPVGVNAHSCLAREELVQPAPCSITSLATGSVFAAAMPIAEPLRRQASSPMVHP